MTRRGGFALLSTLAALALLSAGALAAIAELRGWSRASSYRAAAARAHWAASACVEWMRAEYESDRPARWTSGTVRLTDDLVCRVEDLDPTLRRHLSLIDSTELSALAGADRAAALLDWVDPDDEPRGAGAESDWYRARRRLHPPNRTLRGLEETRFIAGWPEPEHPSTRDAFTLAGDGRVDVNRAPTDVLRSISALPPQRIERIIDRREGGASWETAAELHEVFAAEDSLAEVEIRILENVFVFRPESRYVRVVGEDRRPPVSVRAVLHVHVRELTERIAVTRVEVR